MGFRPFIYQLAQKHGIKGSVANTSSGVQIHAEALPEKLELFEEAIQEKPPLLAVIADISSENVQVCHCTSFDILKSKTESKTTTMLSPDVSVCDECLEEMLDASDRRHNYPFINCTNCGPRYSIITDTPYDREKTSMKHFKLCRECHAEYSDPDSRRFHAQPNACAKCGPSLSLFDSEKKEVTCDDHIKSTVDLLKQGHCVAIKGLGGFHLAVDAENNGSVKRLRDIKDRGSKPFAIMVDSIETVKRFAEISPEEENLLVKYHKPIVLLKKKNNPEFLIAPETAPSNRYIGVMLPYTPLHVLLFQHGLKALVMTSANKKSEPIVIDNYEAFERLNELSDYFLFNNRDIYLRTDDSVARIIENQMYFMRPLCTRMCRNHRT